MVFKNLCILVHWAKMASALEGLTGKGRGIPGLGDVGGRGGSSFWTILFRFSQNIRSFRIINDHFW